MPHPIETIIASTMENLKNIIRVDTVVGDPIRLENDTLVLPVSRVSLGFVSGGGEYPVNGKSIAEVFYENGVRLFRVDNNRVSGWMVLKEMLKPYPDEQGAMTAQLKIFNGCRHLIRTLPAVAVDEHNPNDVATEPHELTHAPDALRYFFAGRPHGKTPPVPPKRYDFEFQKPKPTVGVGEKIRIV